MTATSERDAARRLLKGMVVPLLGAGVNACGRPADFTWNHRDKQHLPTGGELATYLAKEYDAPDELSKTDLIRVSQFIDSVKSSGDELYGRCTTSSTPTTNPDPCTSFSRGPRRSSVSAISFR